MKKLLPLIVIALMLLLLVACDRTQGNANNNEIDSVPPNYSNNGNDTPLDSQPTKYLLKTYSSTDEYGNAGTYTEINSQYLAGDAVELEATVKSGYNFVGWFINGTCVSEDLKYTYIMRSNSVNIEARYNYFTVLTFSNSNDYEKAGTYTELKSKKISLGEQITVEATVNDGYNFAGWFINNVCVSEELTYSFLMKEKNVDLEARWSYYTVSVNSYTDEGGAAGTFTKKTDEKISVGETVILTANVNPGFNFEGWYVNGNLVSDDFEYSFTMKNKNVDVEAKFSCYTVTTYSDSTLEGTIGTYTKISNNISAGDTVTLTAQAAQGCNFEGWYMWIDRYNSICVCEDAEYTFVMGKENVKIEARFSAYTLNTKAFLKTDKSKLDSIKPGINIDFFWTYSFSAYDPSMGDYSQYKNTYIAAGEEVTLTATEKSGYTFLGWKRGFDLVSTNHTYTFVMDKSNVTYEAVYIIKEDA
ncbi:MAG: InlB B-repeat-containing protein [Clostridia bacterium]|nr:InlB B-repeat-containing protein [Clostridia bacterium]